MGKKSKTKHVFRRLIILIVILIIIFIGLCLVTPGEDEMVLATADGEIAGLELPAPVEGEQIIEHTGYTLSYNEEAEQPSWVAYELTRDEAFGDAAEREDNFREDRAVRTGSATLDDYRGSGYDRGHMAPAADFKWSEEAMSDTFYLSNMSPQDGGLNRGLWADLEAIVRQMAVDNGKVYVVTGPVLTDGPFETIGESKVIVPHQYYKVVLDYTDPDIKAIGFVLPNEKCEEDIEYYVRSVDEVEELTGLDFYPALPDDIEAIVEANVDTARWSFQQFSSSSRPEDYTPSQAISGTGGTKQGGRRTDPRPPCPFRTSEEQPDAVDKQGHDVCDDALHDDDQDGAAASHLLLHRTDCGDAWRVEEAEGQECEGRKRREDGRQRRSGSQDCQRAHDVLLGDEACDQGSRDPPVGQAERSEDWSDEAAKQREQGILAVRHDVQSEVEGLEEPDDDRGDEDDREGAGDEVLGLVPHQPHDGHEAREAVGRQLHDEGYGLALEEETVEYEGHDDAHDDAREVEGYHEEGGVVREEVCAEEGVDGQLGRA